MGRPKKYNSKQLTEHLRQLAAEAHDWTEEDGVITKGEAMARLLWKKALGWSESTVDDEGNEKKVYHKPESWAIQLVYERMEGRTPQALTEEEDQGRKVHEEVRDLARARLNDLATAATNTEPANRPPPPPRRKRDDNAE